MFNEVKAIERLPKLSGFYFCIVRGMNENNYSYSVLRFGDVREEGNEEDKEFHANCDVIVEKSRITWLEEIDTHYLNN